MNIVNSGLPRAVVFDLDGTLVDSVPDLRAALNWLMDRLGRRHLDRDEVAGMVGDGVPKLVERALTATGGQPRDDELARQIAVFIPHYEANAAVLTQPFPGAVEALAALHAAGCRIGVCTNKPAGATGEILDLLGLSRYIAAFAGGDTVPGARKPDPRHLAHVLEALGVSPDDTVMVGDNHHDVGVAHSLGMPAIAVSFGYSHGPVTELGAERIIDHFDELTEALRAVAGERQPV